MKIYLVGGAVRDQILGRPIKDRDWVVVDATPADMLALGFEQVGADFPVFLHPVTREEYALARVERKNGEGYHGFEVSTENVTIEQDLSRRDLTINSMAIPYEDGQQVESDILGPDSHVLIDPYGGYEDLMAGVLRHTSEAFSEDPLRVVRLARFAARYDDFTIALPTVELCAEMVREGRLNELPYERFWAELEKVVHEESADEFFYFLFTLDAFKHVKFFNEVFGEDFISDRGKESDEWFTDLASMRATCLNVKSLPAADRMMTLVALLAKREQIQPQGATADFIKLHRNLLLLDAVRDAPTQQAKIDRSLTLMKSAKPWGEGPHYAYLINAVRCMTEVPAIDWMQLMNMGEKMRKIKADLFPNLEGKALGEAIDKARRLNIEVMT